MCPIMSHATSVKVCNDTAEVSMYCPGMKGLAKGQLIMTGLTDGALQIADAVSIPFWKKCSLRCVNQNQRSRSYQNA